MQKILRTILILAFVCGAMATHSRAADPIAGTWKLDLRASKMVLPDPPKAQTESYKELASGDIEMTLTRVSRDGTHATIRLTWPAVGGAVKDPSGALGKDRSAVETLLGPGDWLVTFMDHGKQWSSMEKVISPDGKTMTQTAKFIDARGHGLTQIQVLRRQ